MLSFQNEFELISSHNEKEALYKGRDWALPLALTLALIATGYYLYLNDFNGILLLYLAVFPIILILTGLRFRHEEAIDTALYSEMFLLGCSLSVVIAATLEIWFATQTRLFWICETCNRFTWTCDALFILTIIVSIALSEELAKFIPLSRIERRRRYLPPLGVLWFRLVDSPMGILLAGSAVACGFACMENIKYVLAAGRKDLQYGISTSIARAILAVPFHVACTGYVASNIIQRWFGIPGGVDMDANISKDDKVTLRQNLPSCEFGTGGDSSYTALGSPAVLNNPEESLVCEPASIWEMLQMLAVSTLCHGFYDGGLLIASQLMKYNLQVVRCAENNQVKPALTLLLRMGEVLGTRPYLPHIVDIPGTTCDDMKTPTVSTQMYFWLGVGAVVLSGLSYVTILTLFFRRWKWVSLIQTVAIPRIDRLLDG